MHTQYSNEARQLVLDTVISLAGANCQLVPVRDVRDALVASVERWIVDGCLVLLARSNDIYFFTHDYPVAMTAQERSECITVDGDTFNAVSVRNNHLFKGTL